MLSHLNIVHSAMHYELAFGLDDRDRIVCTVPFSHVTGLIAMMATGMGPWSRTPPLQLTPSRAQRGSLIMTRNLPFCQWGPNLVAGVERAISYHNEDFVVVVADETSGQGVDLILDMVGASYIERNLQCFSLEGCLMQIAFLEDSHFALDATPIMLRRLTLTGTHTQPSIYG